VEQTDELAEIGQHVASVAHELNNSLMIVLLQTRLLNKASASTPRIQEGLTTIQEQTQRMMQMVDDLLFFSRPRPLQLEATDVNSLIRRTLNLGGLIPKDRVRISTRLAVDLPFVQADPDQLQQVFVNLIKNACQALLDRGDNGRSPTKGFVGQLAISTSVIHGDNGHAPRVEIRFSDNGPGIPGDIMPHIFEPFFTTKEAGEGTGLGLAICASIAQAHKGELRAESTASGGATFILDLPVSRPVPSAEPNPLEEAAPHTPWWMAGQKAFAG
jgi:signal transduction histidine kinase